MLDIFAIAGSAIGGLGIFILAIGMMTDGLKLAAGSSLRKILSEWSRTPLRGIFSGLMMTAIVQSSSAVTVASIGFVNAGLIKMRQALGIIYGANIGTTMTGWLVALTGFKLDLHAIALPMIGMGMFLRLTRRHGRVGSAGMALVGFGLFFIGVDVLKSAFDGLVATLDLSQIETEGLIGHASFLLLGILMTVLTQSSSASIAITITAAASGVVSLPVAAVMVIGANVGTTSTAVLASIGATSNAKRVAAVQVIFNIGTAVVALALLPLLFWLIAELGDMLGMERRPEITLALFHTAFNILGVMLVFPVNDRLASFVEKRFVSWEERESHPRFLDSNVASTPVLAVNALVLELELIGSRISEAYKTALTINESSLPKIEQELHVVAMLSTQVSKFIVSIEQVALTEVTTKQLATLMRVDQYLLNCAMSIRQFAQTMVKVEALEDSALKAGNQRFFNHVMDFVSSERFSQGVDINKVEHRYRELQAEHDLAKAELLLAGTKSKVSLRQMTDHIDILAQVSRYAQQWLKAEVRLNELQRTLDSDKNKSRSVEQGHINDLDSVSSQN
ncbi:sodium:phosphate symporter [Oleiphilus sp. HI0071]|uniref:Na/Pi cotransporter family protein n=1 Tax=Oleiphilus sp. HI0080 TaxID=1822255 RepID=UPI0007C38404|nr:Na/Pi cotransporter family protein [Oleiphilus sp. HI0080]KZY64670.1 sodium:phosphate symporter [Oleiphilus sp. HI0065]KZY85017.1 sodium:phosphate symporter [Oleiphilus sp. HI0071]KZZ04978.1 sodium:phosphate symporter [Oleiphilus sp. HI0073]KZZ43698.1 sodium:phosphate symporter [Oleiphilus sp. HI0118]KZZ55069.1 sodium:phosphate symporter [Oleiphilus sp. HI0122]KZZ67112.1 sodium:phosphate symporter [Oleiphilus sp. HI0130]